MSKLHVSYDGITRRCDAKTPESCTAQTLGGEAKHFDNKEDARKYTEDKFTELYGNTESMKKHGENSKAVEVKSFIAQSIDVKVSKSNFTGNSKEVLNVLMDLNPNIDKIKRNGELLDKFENIDFQDGDAKKIELEKKVITELTANTYEDSLKYLVEVCSDESIPKEEKIEELNFFSEEVGKSTKALAKMGIELPDFNKKKFSSMFNLKQKGIKGIFN